MKRRFLQESLGFAILLVAAWAPPTWLTAGEPEVCAICGAPFVDVYYSLEDKVTLEKKHICKECEKSYPVCFVCGLPAPTNAPGFVQLPDQRVLCSRDAKTAVLDEEEGRRICRSVLEGLGRLLSRFTSFPETNVTVGLLDRVHLLEMFKLAGNDYRCPNVWGITQTRTKARSSQYSISIMSGLPLNWFEATSAHEYAHAWVGDHVSPLRRQMLSQDAEEGFCELVSYLYMESLNDTAQTAMILRNAYTRGQIDLFVEAQKTYGFNEIVDWMQSGLDDQLSGTDSGRIRNVASKRSVGGSTPRVAASGPLARPVPDKLMLKAIIWDPKHPLALINDHSFAPNEEARLRVGGTNLLVRCLSITSESVRLRVDGSETEQVLRLNSE